MKDYPGPYIPDVAGRDLCGGGDMPAKARHAEPTVKLENGRGPSETKTFDLSEHAKTFGLLEPNDQKPQNLSERALELVNGARADEYAPPEQNMARIGQTWAAMLGLDKPIPSWRVALMLAALKLIRAAHKPGDDSLVDAVGYVEIAHQLRPDPSLAWADLGLVGGKR